MERERRKAVTRLIPRFDTWALALLVGWLAGCSHSSRSSEAADPARNPRRTGIAGAGMSAGIPSAEPTPAFGFLAGAPGVWRSIFFITVSMVALAVIAALVRTVRDRLPLIAFALIGGGAVGNLIDRVRFGEVVDFIEWYYRSFHWPTFNIADSAITAGVVLLAIDMLFERRKPSTNVQASNDK